MISPLKSTFPHGFLRKLIIFGGWAIPIQGLVDLAACPVSKSTSGGLRRVPLRLGPLNWKLGGRHRDGSTWLNHPNACSWWFQRCAPLSSPCFKMMISHYSTLIVAVTDMFHCWNNQYYVTMQRFKSADDGGEVYNE